MPADADANPTGVPVVMIGLDSADPELLLRWIDEGRLPNLRTIRDRGVWGRLSTPPGLGDDAAWATFYTGTSPGHHGRFFHRTPAANSYSLRGFRSEDLSGEPFWNRLSDAGKKVAVIDVPKCPVSDRFNGIHLADWLVHGRDGATRSWPPALAEEILQKYGDDMTDRSPEYLCSVEALPASRRQMFIERLLDSVNRKTAALLDLVAADHWDAFVAVFKEAHCVGHQFHHAREAKQPEPDRAGPDPVARVYIAIDDALGQIRSAFGPDALTIVFSDLGMTDNQTGEHLLDDVLLRLERSWLLSFWQRIHVVARRSSSRRIRRLFRALHRRIYRWRSAYQVEHNELSGAIRLNLAGREPFGRRFDRSQIEALLDRIEHDLRGIVDVAGRPIVSRILRTEDEFAGPQSNALADIFVVWNREADFRRITSREIGTLKVASPPWRAGNHIPGGIYFACGPGIAETSSEQPGSLLDLAPTVSALVGVPLEEAEGRPIDALLPVRSQQYKSPRS
jgi:predicted AlkP superfamily phosphohydrolase/phosphomutase